MQTEELKCPSNSDDIDYNGSILLASPAYPLQVDSDVR